MNEQTENSKATLKDWLTFIIFTIVIFSLGVIAGFSAGRKHPAASVKDEWLSDVRKEVNLLESSFKEAEEQYQFGIELRDSIITALKREVRKGDNAEVPIKVNVNITDDNSK